MTHNVTLIRSSHHGDEERSSILEDVSLDTLIKLSEKTGKPIILHTKHQSLPGLVVEIYDDHRE